MAGKWSGVSDPNDPFNLSGKPEPIGCFKLAFVIACGIILAELIMAGMIGVGYFVYYKKVLEPPMIERLERLKKENAEREKAAESILRELNK